MKFEILTDRFERRKERTPYGTIPLRRLSDRRDFFLKETAEALLDVPAGIHSFDECFGELDENVRRDLVDGLTLLSAFGAASVDLEEEEPSCTFKVAGERDYYDLAELVNSEKTVRFGVLSGSAEEITLDAMRARQFNNIEYHFLYREQGELKGMVLVGMPSEESYSTAARICAVVLSDDICTQTNPVNSKAEEVIRGLNSCVEDAFRGDMGILRYLNFDNDDPFIPLLGKMGYQETAFLQHETADKRDVRIYDKRIEIC